ncbi:hypothetical protein WN48_10370 [Eufriesea mexicana]|uniref:Uncharacterized protein n=1 Tax=Eufriesea mexicana TaxID=516756 RepID=A0A310S9Q3_9HYME|nr:hypothetical protein WN48_10370 [Eufriesea mexicana]
MAVTNEASAFDSDDLENLELFTMNHRQTPCFHTDPNMTGTRKLTLRTQAHRARRKLPCVKSSGSCSFY